MIENFPHKPPDGYRYEFIQFSPQYIQIRIVDELDRFTYTTDTPVSTCWGYYRSNGKYYSAKSAKRVGKEVDIRCTSPFSATIPTKRVIES